MTTPNKAMSFPANGAAVNQWDTISPGGVNTNFTIVDTALGGNTTLNATGASGTVVLTSTQYIPPSIEITGTLTNNVTYQIPSGVGGLWSVANLTSGSYTVSISIAGNNSISIPVGTSTTPNGRVQIISDGTTLYLASSFLKSPGTAQMVPFTAANGFLTATSGLLFDGSNLSATGGITAGGALTGATLSISGSVSGAGFTSYLASPPAIGTSAAARGSFTQAATPTYAYGNSGSSFTINAALSNVHTVTMTANATMAVSNFVAGQTVNVQLTQDATGSRVITWPASFKWASGSAPALSTTAGAIDLLVVTYVGGNYLASLGKAFA